MTTPRVIAVLVAGLIGVAGCKARPAPSDAASATSAEATAAEAGFESAPQLQTVRRLADGGLQLGGQTTADSTVRLASPGGRAFSAVADDRGAWTLTTPPLETPTLFGLSARAGERIVQAEGYIALLPALGPPAVLLRPGAGAALIGAAGAGVRVVAVDADAAGAVAVSGVAAGGSSLTVYVNDKVEGQGSARDDGRFSIALAHPLGGASRIVVKGGGEMAQAQIAMGPPAKLAKPPYQTERLAGAWRIDWPTPGGGVQTTVLFDRPGGAAGGGG